MKEVSTHPQNSKEDIFAAIRQYLTHQGLLVVSEDLNRPWGGFFVMSESQFPMFKNLFFPEVSLSEAQLKLKLSPKILVVAPDQRLSWQYHHRRAELWKLVAGSSRISRSQTDTQGPVEEMKLGEVVSLAEGERHRLIGADQWGIVAEIWMHTDPLHPSDEEDIVRLSDDYDRR
ncbi:cupin domain-containing protein [Algoriphagus namhaensis]